MKYLFLLLTLSCSITVLSQQREYVNPRIRGMAPPKGVELTYSRAWDYQITSESESPAIGNSNAVIQRNNLARFKFRVPFFNKPYLKLIFGGIYEHQEFVFQDEENLDYGLYDNLQQKHLRTIGISFAGLKPFDSERYGLFQIKANLNGDYQEEDFAKAQFLKVSMSALYGIKTGPDLTYGFGLYWSYNFGRQRIFPAFLYNRTFNERWGIEAILPASLKIRYSVNPATYFYLAAEVDGASYNLVPDDPPLENIPNLQLRRSEVNIFLEFNREIYDFIWFGIVGGIRQPINYRVTEEGDRGTRLVIRDGIRIESGERLINNNVGLAPYAEISLFLVPPKSMRTRLPVKSHP